jgi:hypothetical protein
VKIRVLNQLSNGSGAVDLIAVQCSRNKNNRAILPCSANVNWDLYRHTAVTLTHGELYVA